MCIANVYLHVYIHVYIHVERDREWDICTDVVRRTRNPGTVGLPLHVHIGHLYIARSVKTGGGLTERKSVTENK